MRGSRKIPNCRAENRPGRTRSIQASEARLLIKPIYINFVYELLYCIIVVIITLFTPHVKDRCLHLINAPVTPIHIDREEREGPKNKKVGLSYYREGEGRPPKIDNKKGGILAGDLLYLAGDIETNPGPDRAAPLGKRDISRLEAPAVYCGRGNTDKAKNPNLDRNTKGVEEVWGQEDLILEETQYPGFEDDDPELIRDREPFDPSQGGVRWEEIIQERYRENKLTFKAVLANRRFKGELAKRLSNAVFHCNCERNEEFSSGLECYKELAKIFCRTPVVSGQVINLFNSTLKGGVCMICLQNAKGARDNLVEGTTCSDLCEQALLDKFRDNAGDYHAFKISILRGWNILFVNKTNFPFSCKTHMSNKVCLINSVDFGNFKAQLEDKKVNSLKARKSRARRTQQLIRRLPENMADVLDEINTGTKCAVCMMDLSCCPEEIILNEGISLNFCSEVCESEAKINLKFNFHENRNMIIFTAVARHFHLHLDYFKLSRRRHGHQVSEDFLKMKDKKGDNTFRIELKESSSYIVSFNCNGAKNIHKVKTYCKEKKPAVVGLQEIRSEDKRKLKRKLVVQGYTTVSASMDTAILVREDIKILESGYIETMLDLPHEFVQVETPAGKYRVINVYCRDGLLTYTQLSIMENFGSRTFCIGDFNAKHRDFLTHTQVKDSNRNGDTLYGYLFGDNAFEQESKLYCHNVNSPNVYSRAIDGKWVQLDLIFSHPNIIDTVDKFIYDDSLLSDHKAVAIYCPGIFRPKEKYIYFNEEIDWDSYNEIQFRAMSCEAIQNLKNSGEWKELSLNEKAIRLQDIIKACVEESTVRKKRSTRKNPLPQALLLLIKERRESRVLLSTIESETNKRIELRLGIGKKPKGKLKWTSEELEAHKAKESSYRAKISVLSMEINEAFSELRADNWKEALTGLSQLDPRKACKEFWKTITRLSGKGSKAETPSYITYKGVTATGHKEIAETFANFYEDTYKPQVNEAFDQELIKETTAQADRVRSAWELPEIVNEDKVVQMTVKDTVLRKGKRDLLVGKAKPPRPTKAMKKNNPQLIDRKLYLGQKKPLPNLEPLDLRINRNLIDIHNTDQLKRLKREVEAEFDMGELLTVLSNTKRKAPGNDGIFINQLKDLHASAKMVVLELYNEIWESGSYPDVWKKAILVPIMKKGKVAGDPLSYRPISLLPIMGKVLESLVHPRLERYFMERKLIPDFQTGFRKGHSTSINLRRLFSNSYFQSTIGVQKRPTVSVFFDAKKAFDTVWHEGLIVKMAKDGVPAKVIRFVGNWLLGRMLKVRIGREYSRNIPLKSGVPQGSVISPLLWNYWLGDCPATISPHAFSALYADDVALWVSHPSYRTLIRIVNEEIKNLVQWIRRKRLVFTQEKTMAMVTHANKQSRNKVKALHIFMDEDKQEEISWRGQAVLLGVLFHESGSFAPHIYSKVKLANARVRALWRFNKAIDGDKLYNVYKAAIEPILTYGSEVFYEGINEVLAKKLLSVEFGAIRCCYGLRKETSKADMLGYFKDSSIMTRIDKRRQRFLEANLGHPLIEFNETTPFSQGRRHRSRKYYIPPGVPRDWRRALYVHKPRVFFSDLSRENLSECRTHYEFTKDKMVEIIGQNADIRRQVQVGEDVTNVNANETRGIPSYDMMNSMLEGSPDQEQVVRQAYGGLNPRFRLVTPGNWELRAMVQGREGQSQRSICMTGEIRRSAGNHNVDRLAEEEIPDPGEGMESPGEMQEASGEECSRALHNIEETANQEDNESKGRWVETVEDRNGIQARSKVWILNPSLPTEAQMEQQEEPQEFYEEGTAGGYTPGHTLDAVAGWHLEQRNRRETTRDMMQNLTGPSQEWAAHHDQGEYGVNGRDLVGSQAGVSLEAEGALEARLLGYALSQEISGVSYGAEEGYARQNGKEGYGYSLGEIACESFNDRHGVWQNSSQIFPSQMEGQVDWSWEEPSQGQGGLVQYTEYRSGGEENRQLSAGEEIGGERLTSNNGSNLHDWAEKEWQRYMNGKNGPLGLGGTENAVPNENALAQGHLVNGHDISREGVAEENKEGGEAPPSWSDLDKCFEEYSKEEYRDGMECGPDAEREDEEKSDEEMGEVHEWVGDAWIRHQEEDREIKYSPIKGSVMVDTGNEGLDVGGGEDEDGILSEEFGGKERNTQGRSTIGGPPKDKGQNCQVEAVDSSPKVVEENRSSPRFIEGLYQDTDLWGDAITQEGGITFEHTCEGDIHKSRREGVSTIPERYPPMSSTTVDWSVLYKGSNANLRDKGKLEEGQSSGAIAKKGTSKDTGRIKLKKGRYSKKRSGKGETGGRRRGETGSKKHTVSSGGGIRGRATSPGEREARRDDAARDEEPGTSGGDEEKEEEEEEEAAEENEMRKQEERRPKTRSRGAVVVIREGRFITKENPRAGGASGRKAGFLPRRGEIITREMADPNRRNGRYRVMEDSAVNARTSGVFWRNTEARHSSSCPGTSKKTLHDRASNTSSTREQMGQVEGNQEVASDEEEDSLHLDPG